jgi:transcriptional regulator with XRE-family HTH domain
VCRKHSSTRPSEFAQVLVECVAMTHGEGWNGALHQRIAGAIKQQRHGRMSAQELADATARLGYPITRSQIANYKSGRKQSLDVAELLVIAAALNLAPLELLFPDEPDHPVEYLPDQATTTLDASTWFVGEPDWLVSLRDQLDQLVRAITGQGHSLAVGVVHKKKNQ